MVSTRTTPRNRNGDGSWVSFSSPSSRSSFSKAISPARRSSPMTAAGRRTCGPHVREPAVIGEERLAGEIALEKEERGGRRREGDPGAIPISISWRLCECLPWCLHHWVVSAVKGGIGDMKFISGSVQARGLFSLWRVKSREAAALCHCHWSLVIGHLAFGVLAFGVWRLNSKLQTFNANNKRREK